MTDIPSWAALPAGILLIAGGLLTAIGSFGLLRMPTFSRGCIRRRWALRSASAAC